MTHKATLTQSGSFKKQASPAPLADAIEQHLSSEIVSFHTPGHKGIAPSAALDAAWKLDLTELPGTDELANASGVLARLQESAATLWGAQQSFLSVNGASAALIAAIMSCAGRRKKALLPRNSHRSVIHALVLTGLEPVWYEPVVDENWQMYAQADSGEIDRQLSLHGKELACALVVSPTYGGALSDIERIATSCRRSNVPLIVDEAHGAHLIPTTGMPPSAISLGADVVVHSLHKTLAGLTQTGLVHVSAQSLVPAERVHSALNLLQTSSPSYLLMFSAEQAIANAGEQVQGALGVAQKLACALEQIPSVCLYRGTARGASDPLHILIRAANIAPEELSSKLEAGGIFVETVVGNGVLLLIGTGSTALDAQTLCEDVTSIVASLTTSAAAASTAGGTKAQAQMSDTANSERLFQAFGEQVLSPRNAFLCACETVPLARAAGRIAAECIAPCPPGTPVVLPGQRITHGVLSFCKQATLRVVVDSQNQGEQ